MEHSERDEWQSRPEYDRHQPSRLFLYGREKARYLRAIVSENGLPEAIENLADELDAHITHTFDTMPLVTVEGDDISYTQNILPQGDSKVLEIGVLPLVGDAEVTGSHTITGYLYGFHMGSKHDIRAYVSVNDEPRKLMGGIYTPLLSVGMESPTTEISLTETVVETELERIGKEINLHLNTMPRLVKLEVRKLLEVASSREDSAVKKLHAVGPIITQVARLDGVTPQLIEALFEYTKYRLGLFIPHDITTTLHREKLPTVKYSFKPIREHRVFENITPTFELIGESNNKSLGLVLISDDKWVQVPVEYITSMYRTE